MKESSTRPWHWCAPPQLAGQMVCLVGYLRENQEFKSFSRCSLHWLHTNECLARAFNLEPNCLHTQRGQVVEPWNSGSGPVKGGCNPVYFRVIGYNHFMVCWTRLIVTALFWSFSLGFSLLLLFFKYFQSNIKLTRVFKKQNKYKRKSWIKLLSNKGQWQQIVYLPF